MSLVLNEEQTQLRDSARGFLTAEAPVAHLRMLRDKNDATGFSRDLWSQCAQMGFAGVLVKEQHGGFGLGLMEAAVIAEELGRTLTPTPFLSTAVLGALLLEHAGKTPLAAEWLPRIANGQAVVALALDERARHDPAAITTALSGDSKQPRVTAKKVFVLDGHVADLLLVAVRGAIVAVDPKAQGVRIERTVMTDGHNAARVTLENAPCSPVPLEDADAAIANVLDHARVCIAAQLLGAGEEAFQRTTTYLKDRNQFGRKIGEFQALQHRAAILYCELEMTRAAVMQAVNALANKSPDAATAVSVAKAKACGAAGLAVQEAVQMHGGTGMTDALDIGFFMKRVRVLQEFLGDASFHENRVAQLNGY